MACEKRLKILILTLMTPYPANDGGKICVFGFIDYLRRYHDFTCLISIYDDFTFSKIEELKTLWPDVTIILADSRKNVTDVEIKNSLKKSFKDRAFKKIENILFQSYSFFKKYTTAPEPQLKTNTIDTDLMLNSDFSCPFTPINKDYLLTLTGLLSQNQYDIIQVQLTRILNLVNVLPRDTIKIFEQIESRHSVIRDYLEVQNSEESYLNYSVETCEELELYFMKKYNVILTLNSDDEMYIRTKLPSMNVSTSPFGVLDKDISLFPFIGTAQKLVFSGSGDHYPNFDALKWYLTEMHPDVVSLTGLELYISGNWSYEHIEIIKNINSESVHFVGFVDDYNSFLKNSIMIVPIRLGGGGLRTKILYSMANAIPIVSTSIGSYGIGAENSKNILIADSKDEFIQSIFSLHVNISLYQQISLDSFNFYNQNYSQTVTSEKRNTIYKSLVQF